MSFIVAHSWDIILAVVEVIIGVATAYFYRREERRNENSAMRERANRARDELLDIIESRIMSNHDVSEELIHTLLKALEREHRVTLRDSCSRIELLQDVALRLQKSNYLMGLSRNLSNGLRNGTRRRHRPSSRPHPSVLCCVG